MPAFHLYLDDSGTRHPDKAPKNPDRPDWFGLGGLLINVADEAQAKARYDNFRLTWEDRVPPTTPLHSHEIRQMKDDWAWLRDDKTTTSRFLDDLSNLLTTLPVYATACVIDRPGHRAKYQQYTSAQRWSLCRTAFSVLLERSLKFAMTQSGRLFVSVERSDKNTDAMMKGHYNDLKTNGLPFNPVNMDKYVPLPQIAFKHGLLDFRTKTKASKLMQLADLYLYPLCQAPYNESKGRDYAALVSSKKIVDQNITRQNMPTMGIKYSCFPAGTDPLSVLWTHPNATSHCK